LGRRGSKGGAKRRDLLCRRTLPSLRSGGYPALSPARPVAESGPCSAQERRAHQQGEQPPRHTTSSVLFPGPAEQVPARILAEPSRACCTVGQVDPSTLVAT